MSKYTDLVDDDGDRIRTLKGMYEDYFLDYASYVILERAVPAIADGLKPVQRRILHALRTMDDGRYHKVANAIGQTMQYHPHGDAAIGDALVKLGQKNLLIDPQGNWGDVRTGDSAAAARYIEARLTKFALEVAFNPQTTVWQATYDGRKKEPVNLPMKFPLLLASGAEGIAVGLSTKVLPHNFIELIEASIKHLRGKRFKLYPDFETGGYVDVENYNDGQRGGKVRVRARIEEVDKKTLAIRELPFGVTTSSIIDSILKANDKGKIKIKKIWDNTAEHVEILIDLHTGISPTRTMDALYAFTDCETSISPNSCVIVDDKPLFLSTTELLKISTDHTRELLKWELKIRKGELLEKLHFASLEKIFIQQRIYRDIEEAETWEAVLSIIRDGLRQYVSTPAERKSGKKDNRLALLREITEEDIVKLTEIKIKRISKYNSFKADELIAKMEEELQQVNHDLEHITDYAIAYFENLLSKYGQGRERKTEIKSFDTIKITEVVANNAKLYVNRKEGFIGMGLKKDEFVCDCSDIDDIIIFRKDGKFQVTKIADKSFVGKDIIYVSVWKRGDDRTTYNMAYLDAKSGRSYVKRFNVSAITRDREYDLTTGEKYNLVHYFEAHPNGEAEVIRVLLSKSSRAKIKDFEFDFGSLEIKGRSSKGNILTKYPVRKIEQISVGKSTIGAQEIWYEPTTGRLNTNERGNSIGKFDTGDSILVLYNDGTYELTDFELTNRYEPEKVLQIHRHDAKEVITAVYYEGSKGWTMVKRFQIETTSLNEKFNYLTDDKKSKLYYATTDPEPTVECAFKIKSKVHKDKVELADIVTVKGWKAMGNKLSEYAMKNVKPIEVPPAKEKPDAAPKKSDESSDVKPLKPGDTLEFDL